MIPEFDGTSRHKLHEFLNASTYAMNNIERGIIDSGYIIYQTKRQSYAEF